MQKRLNYVAPKYQLEARRTLPTAAASATAAAAASVDAPTSNVPLLANQTVDTLHDRLREMYTAPMPSQLADISMFLAKTVILTEALARRCDQGAGDALQLANTAWHAEEALFNLALDCRSKFDHEHRRMLWCTRLRCITLASNHCRRRLVPEGGDATAESTRALRQTRVDAMSRYYGVQPIESNQFIVYSHGVLWPTSHRLGPWCAENGLLLSDIAPDALDAGLRRASVHSVWMLVKTLLDRWMHVPYSCYLIAYTMRLVERVADLTSYSSSNAREFNHPTFVERVPGKFPVEYRVNERFLKETERTFYALQVCLHRCAFVRWPRPVANPHVHAAQRALFVPDAVERLEHFVGTQLNTERYKQFIEKDFEVVFFDHVVHPGEMEVFAEVRPTDDRKPMSCLSRMRRNDFNRYQTMYMEPAVVDVWKRMMTEISLASNPVEIEAVRTHPAYMLLVTRALQFHFDSVLHGAEFDAYLCEMQKIPMNYIGRGGTSLTSALRDHMGRTVTRGSVRHVLGMTLLKQGATCTRDSQYPHPLIVSCVGQYAVVRGEYSEALGEPTNISVAFLLWLREFVSDPHLCGTFVNQQSVVGLLRGLQPFADTQQLADTAEAVCKQLTDERMGLAAVSQELRALCEAAEIKL